MTYLPHDWFPRPVPESVRLGERTWLHSSYAFHHNRGAVRIGSGCGIYVGCQFELGPDGSVDIADYCTVVGAVIASNGPVRIGDHTFIAHEVTIADSAFAVPPDDTPRPPSEKIEIGSGAWIGTRAVILAGARIGDEAIVGAGAVVAGPVPRGATVVGNPARVVSR
jgi:acetyltransferase-like isoleucine patch superfamily enzyme